MRRLKFQTKLVISLHLPQCMFVCTFVSEMREQGHLITQGQLSNILCDLFSHIPYENSVSLTAKLETLSLSAISGLLAKAKAAVGKAHLSFPDNFEVSYSFSVVFGSLPLLL